jgi:hypothetical protein
MWNLQTFKNKNEFGEIIPFAFKTCYRVAVMKTAVLERNRHLGPYKYGQMSFGRDTRERRIFPTNGLVYPYAKM